MTTNTMPDDAVRGIGQRLRTARETAGMSLADASAKLKMQTHVVDALEREDWAKLGAPVYIRGQLRSYAKLLGLPADAIVDTVVLPTTTRAADLVPQTYTPRIQRVAEQTKLRLVYVVLTAAIAVPVWLAIRPHATVSEDTTAALELAPGEALPADPGIVPAPKEPAPVLPSPVIASMTPMPQPPVAQTAPDLSVSFSGESWVKLIGPDGTVIEQTLIQPGQQRNFAAGQIGKAVLGNATAVSVRVRGQPADLTPFIRANVVRFTVSSDGSLQPVAR